MIDMPLLRQAKNIVHLQQHMSASGSADTKQSTDSQTWQTPSCSLCLCISINAESWCLCLLACGACEI